MSDIEFAVKECKKLEALLETGFGATGRGLHEKVSSVEKKLPPPLVRRLRFIATVRNKLVHEPDHDKFENEYDYHQACAAAGDELRRMIRPRGTPGAPMQIILVVILAIVGGVTLLALYGHNPVQLFQNLFR
ncbi:MAG: hypothetical protein K1X57_15830 [Gemmataceae bacterium]|nr:hypothetical protein [Gemmataceae bacterium]